MMGASELEQPGRRIRKGMSLSEVEQVQEEQPVSDVQDYLNNLIARDPFDLPAITRLPFKSSAQRSNASSQSYAEASAEDDVEAESEEDALLDRNSWIYESLRRICRDLTSPWLLALQQEYTRQSCHDMKGGEWLYLCAAHASNNETECCAIDYISHALDQASALLCSKRFFPSRIGIPDSSFKHFTSISRRLYRIFSHTYFHHNEVFQTCEAESSLYARYKLLLTQYDILSEEILAVPASYESHHEGEAPVDDSGAAAPAEDMKRLAVRDANRQESADDKPMAAQPSPAGAAVDAGQEPPANASLQ